MASCSDPCKSRLWLGTLGICSVLTSYLSLLFPTLAELLSLNCVHLTSFYLAKYSSSLPQVKRTDRTFKLKTDFKLGSATQSGNSFSEAILPWEAQGPKVLVFILYPEPLCSWVGVWGGWVGWHLAQDGSPPRRGKGGSLKAGGWNGISYTG